MADRDLDSPVSIALNSVLLQLETAVSLEEAIQALAPLAKIPHKSLRKFWSTWLRPTLEKIPPAQKPGLPAVLPPSITLDAPSAPRPRPTRPSETNQPG